MPSAAKSNETKPVYGPTSDQACITNTHVPSATVGNLQGTSGCAGMYWLICKISFDCRVGYLLPLGVAQ